MCRGVCLALVAAALIAAGCGGGYGDGSTNGGSTSASEPPNGPTLTKEKWIRRADEICTPGERRTDQAINQIRGPGPPRRKDLDRFATETLAPTVKSDLREIRRLPPPAGAEEAAKRILDAAQKDLDRIEAANGIFFSGGGPFVVVNRLAQKFGLRVCGWL